jgi:hypothetical protein
MGWLINTTLKNIDPVNVHLHRIYTYKRPI